VFHFWSYPSSWYRIGYCL